MPKLPRLFFDRDVVTVARELLGMVLVRQIESQFLSGRIVETEAYLASGDSACHASKGKSKKNATMFGPPGHAYVYAIHSRWCLNVVTEPEHVPSAVLIRAIEPLEGLSVMRQNRDVSRTEDVARGPGRLCEALAIDRQLDGWDLVTGQVLWIRTPRRAELLGYDLGVSPRIGVTSAADLPLRFFVRGSRYVSGPRKWHS